MQQEEKPRERSFISELVPDWRPTREQVRWAVRITIVLVVILGILTLIGLPFRITLWEWMKLLIVPAVIAVGGLWFNRQQRGRELEIAERRAQDEALQTYLDQMSQMLADKDRPLRKAPSGDDLRTVARARTLTVLGRLDRDRKGTVVQFLYDSHLISKHRPVIALNTADLREATLREAVLNKCSLIGAWLHRANLVGADLNDADLSQADLSEADLSSISLSGRTVRVTGRSGRFAAFRGEDVALVALQTTLYGASLAKANLYAAKLANATLSKANLVWADLRTADLRGADLTKASLDYAWMDEANLSGTNLSEASLLGANLSGADLSEADLSGAQGLTNEELELKAKALEGATMPNGQIYEYWLTVKVLTRKYGGDSEVVRAASKFAERPNSLGRKEILKEQLEAAGADQDPEVRRMVQELLKQTEAGDKEGHGVDGDTSGPSHQIRV
jgi:uncharacterized protein YjbI with pentapeptide repeats